MGTFFYDFVDMSIFMIWPQGPGTGIGPWDGEGLGWGGIPRTQGQG